MKGLSPEQQKQLILSIGVHQSTRPLTPVEVGSLLKTAVLAGNTPRQLAEFVHLEGATMISRFMRLLELPNEVHHLVDWGTSQSTIGFTAASELARLKATSDQNALITAALENKLSNAEIKQIVQARTRSHRDIQQCITEILGMRPNIQRIHVFIGSVTGETIRQKLSALTQRERDEILSRVLHEIYPDLDKFAARLGIQRFTITGGEAVAATLKSGKLDFEGAINKRLTLELSNK